MAQVNRARFRDALRQGMSLDAAFGYAEATEANSAGKGHPLHKKLLRDTIKNSVKEGGMPHEVLFRAMSKKIGGPVANVVHDDDMGGSAVNELSDVGSDPGMISGDAADELFFQGPKGKSSRFLMGDRKGRLKAVRDALGASPKNITPTLSPAKPAASAPASTKPPALPKAAPAAPKPAAPAAPAPAAKPAVGSMTGKEVASHPVAQAIRGVEKMANFANEQRLAAGRQAQDSAKRQPDGTFRPGEMTPANDTADGLKAFVDRKTARKAR